LVALNSGRSPTLPPVKSKTKDYTAKMLESAVNSDVIRKIAKEILNKDSMAIFETLKTFMSKVEKDEKKVEELEKFAFFFVARIGLLAREGKFKKVKLDHIHEVVHESVDKVIDAIEIPFCANIPELQDYFQKILDLFAPVIKPCLTAKHYTQFLDFFAYLKQEEILDEFFTPKKYPETKVVGTKLRELWDADLI